jgi:hypothetical protein
MFPGGPPPYTALCCTSSKIVSKSLFKTDDPKSAPVKSGESQRLVQRSTRCGRRIVVVAAGQDVDRTSNSFFFRSIIFSRVAL